MKKSIFKTIIILFLISFGCEKDDDFGAQPHEISDDYSFTSLQVDVLDFENLDGDLAIAIFSNENDFDSGANAYVDTVIDITSEEMSFFIENMDPGSYAVSVFHDADQSGDITFGGFLNLMPQEGFGFSNNPNIGVSQPSFHDCSFEINEGQTILVPINLVYL
tara:strand:+ start:1287 stop:1775 length:489 start_codon:yes stop_codon:yes gene_type:complete